MAEPVYEYDSLSKGPVALALEGEGAVQATDPEWRMLPLVGAVGVGLAHQFFWKAETDTIQTYEHRLSYRYVHLDKETGQFYNQQREPITVDAALLHALAYGRIQPTEMSLAPVVLEPNLLPFTRPFARSENAPSAQPAATGATRTLFSSLASRVQSMCKAFVSFSRSSSDSVRSGDAEQRALVPYEPRELKVSAFTRRTV